MLKSHIALQSTKACLFALVAGLMAGCPEGSDVAVGVGDSLNLGECSGAATDCKSSGTSTTAGSSEPKRCTGEVAGTLQAVFRVDVNKRLCPNSSDGACSASGVSIAVGADGSVWTLALVGHHNTATSAALWLFHHSADGAELGANVIVNWPLNVQYQADVAALPNGEAAVVVYASVSGANADFELDERVWVQRYRSDISPSGQLAWLTALGVAGLTSTSDGKLMLGGDAPGNKARGVLALLDGNTLVWNQTNIPSVGTGKSWGVTGLSTGAAGNTTMLSVRDLTSADQGLGVIKFDGQGNRLWDVKLAARSRSGIYAWFAADAAGNSAALAELPEGAPPNRAPFLLQSLDANGAARFSYLFEAAGGLAVDRESGHLFVTDTARLGHFGIHDIAADGSRCRLFNDPSASFDFNAQKLEVRGDSVYTNAARYRLVPNE